MKSLSKASRRLFLLSIMMEAGCASAFAEAVVTHPVCQRLQADSTALDSIPYANITYTDESVPPYSLAEFCEKAGTVIFKVNKTDIAPDNSFLNDLRNTLLPRIREKQLQLYRIELRGAASPEGPTNNNERLAVGRAKILRDSVTAILPSAQGDIIKMSSVTEDYELLLYYMREANDPDTELVEAIYNKWKDHPADLKWALFTAKKRTLWPRLLAEYFPQLRATRVMLYFHIDPEAVPKEPEPAVEEPKELEPLEPEFPRNEPQTPAITPDEPLPPVELTEVDVHRRPVLAVSTNLLYDLWYMPDFGFAPMWNGRIEYYPHRNRRSLWNHTAFAISFTNPYYHKWDKHKFYQIRNYEIETRFYHRYDTEWQQRYGWYLGAALDNNIYGIGLSDTRGWQGEGLGGQITAGYVLPLDKCKSWKLEFNIGFGIYGTRYDPYIYDDPFKDANVGHGEYDPSTFLPDPELHYYYKWYGSAADFRKRQHRFIWMGPTQIGISIKYDLLWKRKQRHGVSFRHTETVIKPVSPTEKGGAQ